MGSIATFAGMAGPRPILMMVAAVFAFSAFIGWMAWVFLKSSEKTLADPRRLRRRLIFSGALYLLCAINAILEVATGKMPPLALVGLPIGLTLVWLYLRAASRVKIPQVSPCLEF
jgi:hypothetical protein